jgi:predicted transcriptional regulator
MVTTTISLPEPDLMALQHLAVERRTTVRDLMREALADLLKQARKQKGGLR